ncbi:hypothetical protein CANINC_004210 [Pichia inconspicua]|uniref:Guanine nucleotide-binding protein alpha-2 subunit n=1 Tax=Pichia inconspicua TaxID=52247 RepID=A0A4V4NF94_9ASCO|nr:hypothetical protein CANINC_004210 [[Candida] inconspicua]
MGICGSKLDDSPPAVNKTKLKTPTKTTTLSTNSEENKPKNDDVQPIATKGNDNTTNDVAISSRQSKLETVDENSVTKATKTKKPTVHAKILLLGSGESGKSTILRQIKIIHQNGFSDSEKLDYKPFVFQNVIESIQCVIKALNTYNLESQVSAISSEDLVFLREYEIPYETESDVTNLSFDPHVADLIERLLSDEIVKSLLSDNKYEFYILDSAKYFFENLERIRKPDYLPSISDILRTRKQTSGIFDTKFQMDDLDIHLYDVGGQRSERKKWIHCFDNVTAIIFCVSLSEYDQTLLEAPDRNRLEESLSLFESVVNSMWFKRTAVILCLNKIDIFIDKLQTSPLEKYFPDYVGGANVNKAVKYILWRFKQLNRANLNLVPYVTQATDTDNIRLAFAIVRETVLHNNLLDSGLISS